MKFGFTDMVYTISDKNRFDVILGYLKENNICHIRFGLNLVTVKSKNKFGDVMLQLDMLKKASNMGFKLHIYLFLSDEISNAGTGECLEIWKGLSFEEISLLLANDCKEMIDIFLEHDIPIVSYTVGNETEWGVCGYRIGKRIPDNNYWKDCDYNWLGSNLWLPTAKILEKCCKVIREKDASTKIVIHSDSIGNKDFTYEYFNYINQYVDYDVIGLTYNPWTIWDEDYDNCNKIKNLLTKIQRFNKLVWIVEYAYPKEIVTNGELTNRKPRPEFSYNKEGQTNFHINCIEIFEQYKVDMLFFWRGEHERIEDISEKIGIFYDGKITTKLLKKIKEIQ